MARIDVCLVRDAQRFTTGAHIHKTRELVAMYVGAHMSIAEGDGPGLPDACSQFERALRDHVGELRSKRSQFSGVCV